MPKPKTTGLRWLELSIVSFNGSGYANRDSAEAYLESYIKYKQWKRKPEAVKLAEQYYHSVLPLAEHLLEAVYPTTHKPALMDKFIHWQSKH